MNLFIKYPPDLPITTTDLMGLLSPTMFLRVASFYQSSLAFLAESAYESSDMGMVF
jgi:hypothetical protein